MQSNSNIKLTLAYDGTTYFGFQKTIAGPSIESEVSLALENILHAKVKLQGSSRTDRGVHANCQVINFFLPKPFSLISLKKGLNAHLPKQIRIKSVEKEESSFHPTLSAKSKTYCYTVDNGAIRSPFRQKSSWHIHHPLDIAVMRKAAIQLVGKYDFAAFATLGHHEDTVRHITSIEIEKRGDLITFTIKGKSFLYRMVRAIVGTLIYIGKGKLDLSDCKIILHSCDRKIAGPSAPAQGLCLVHIDY